MDNARAASARPTDSGLEIPDWGNGALWEFIVSQAPVNWRDTIRRENRNIVTKHPPAEVLASILHMSRKATRRKNPRRPKDAAEFVKFLRAELKNQWYEELGCYEQAKRLLRGRD